MSGKQFNVIDFGAVSGVESAQTKAIQRALDTCFLAGGGEVIIPAGMSFVTGDVRIRSNTTLHLMENAVLLGSLRVEDYENINSDTVEPLPKEQNTRLRWQSSREWNAENKGFKTHLYTAGSYWNYGIIRAVYAENIAVIGEEGARIDGRNLFDPNGENQYRGSHAINMHFCKNVRFCGYTVENSGNWGHAIFQSENITFEKITVLAGHDAIHTRSCRDVIIKDCRLMTGDDAIAGFNNIGVTVQNCEISSACSAFRYGGRDILVENCDVWGPCPYQFRGSFTYEEKSRGLTVSENGRNNMLSFWTNFVSDDLPVTKTAGNILIRNCTVRNADRFLHLNLSGNEAWQRGNPPTDITFEGVKAEGIKQGGVAYGLKGAPMKITLRDVEFSYGEYTDGDALFDVAYCDEVNIEVLSLKGFKGKTLLRAFSDGVRAEMRGLDCNSDGVTLIERADKAFECKPI